MEPQEELEQLMTRQETLKRELKARKKELLKAQRTRKETLKRQIAAPNPALPPHSASAAPAG